MEYSIGEFAKITHLSIHTLRYYEKECLVIPQRRTNNRRFYTEKDAAWIAFVKRLKDTGMPIREIRRYAFLRAEGDSTLQERMGMLVLHREHLTRRIGELEGHMRSLDDKLDFYRKEIVRAKRKE